MNAVQPTVGRGLLRTLSGFKNYPRGDGESRFVDALCEISLSVEHAASTLLCFDGEFPTIREMREAALNLRPKFEAKAVDQKKEWEAKYGKPDPGWSQRFTEGATANAPTLDPAARKKQHREERRAMLWQAIRDSIFYTETPMGRAELARIDDKKDRIEAFTFWRLAAERNQNNHPEEAAAFRVELQECGWDKLMVYDWANGTFPPVARPVASGAISILANPITQADINAELRRAGREPGDDE